MELIVAMSLFAIFTSVAFGGFIQSVRSQRIVASLMAANDSAGLTLEQIAKELRTSYDFCPLSSQKIQFINASNNLIRYRFNQQDNSIERGINYGGLNEDNCSAGDAADADFTYKKITADNVRISNFNIEICGNNINSAIPLILCEAGRVYSPRITIIMSVTSPDAGIESFGIGVDVQTTISARRID